MNRYTKGRCSWYSTFRMVALALIVPVSAIISACTAHYPVNTPIASIDALDQYSLKKTIESDKSDELLLLLSFSGGGTRAAAFSYGVLEALRDTEVNIGGRQRRLVDEVDGITSVSGGSFTAAYYGLFGDRIFSDFDEKFLKRDVQGALVNQVLSPLNWPKLWSLYYTRSDLAAEYYDELLFENKTFQDFQKPNSPVIAINATDSALGAQFTFIGKQFEPICTDLFSFPVSRAVTASSAVPGAFPSVILKNHAGECDYQPPEWAEAALKTKTVNTRRYVLANNIRAYRDVSKYPYIHLFDGGITDNLGIRAIINPTLVTGNMWEKLDSVNMEATNKLVVIAVNSRKAQDISFAKRDYSLPLFDTIGVTSSIPLDHFSFETMDLLRSSMKSWQRSITRGRCAEKMGTNGSAARNDCEARTYLIEVSFDILEDENERAHLKNLPTTFQLAPGDVDRLRAAAAKILTKSEVFQALINDLTQ